MTDRQLRYIIEIAKEGNITSAAQKLYISQPSLSSLLAHVEAELGAKLFDRSVSPIALTYAGEKYIESAEKILSTMGELQNLFADIGESRRGRLRIGCGPQQSPFVIPLILPGMIKRYPEVEFHITESSRALLVEDLLSGKLDVLIAGVTVDNPVLHYEELISQEFILMAPRGFRAKLLTVQEERALPCIDLHSLENENFVLMKEWHHLRVMQDRIFREVDFKPNIILETDNWQTSLRMVESGVAFTVLPNAAVEFKEQNYDKYCLENQYIRRTYLCYRKSAYISKVMADFIVAARRALKNSGN